MENLYELMEEIDLGSAELEEVQKSISLEFPAVTVTRGDRPYFYFNVAAKPLFENFDKVKFFTTPEYIVFADGKGDWKNTFSIIEKQRRSSDKSIYYSYYKAIVPAALKEKKIQPGCYKLYKCKQGFAFKRYEPLEVSNATA